jgi:hypothetical protein
VKRLILAYCPSLGSTLFIERNFNAMRTSERLLRCSSQTGPSQVHAVGLRGLSNNVGETGFRVAPLCFCLLGLVGVSLSARCEGSLLSSWTINAGAGSKEGGPISRCVCNSTVPCASPGVARVPLFIHAAPPFLKPLPATSIPCVCQLRRRPSLTYYTCANRTSPLSFLVLSVSLVRMILQLLLGACDRPSLQ